MYSFPGTWKNFDDIEESLCLKEIEMLVQESRKLKDLDRRFAAAIQGIDLDKEKSKEDEFNKVKERAIAKAAGVSEEQVALGEFIDFVDEDEEGVDLDN